jgi:predicted MFS family arabinose efflux permease
MLAGRIGKLAGRTRTVLLSGFGMGLSSLLIPFTSAGIGLLFYVIGAGMVAFWITANNVIAVSLRQTLCPDHLLGRMNASTRFLAWATLPLGGILGGALGTSLGLRPTIWLTSVGLLLSALWLVLSPTCRARDLPHD